MKVDVISWGGRKKDFWDLHELMDRFTIADMIRLHKQRYPYGHDADAIRSNLVNFRNADNDFDPYCLKGKHWELIKLDIIETMRDGGYK